MHYLEYNEPIQHRTGDLALAYYDVNERHPRYSMRLHWHRETELIRIGRGRLHLYVDDETIEAEAGDLIVVAEGALHSGEPEDCEYECIVLDPYAILMHIEPCKQAVRGLLGHTVFLKSGSVAADPGLKGSLDRLYAHVRSGVEGGELKVVGSLTELFGYLVDNDDASLRLQSTRTGVKADQLKPALEYIEKNYGQHISLDVLARLTGLSPKYFCRCFRAIVHHSPIDYLNRYRIECASVFLMTSDMTVAEIAQHCGFSDSSFFIKQFRRYKGTTPKKYRSAGGPASEQSPEEAER